MARQEGFEPPTDALEGRCSIQLSYCLNVVLGPGVEPGHLAARDFKSLVSTYFTKVANVNYGGPPVSRTRHQWIMSPLL